MPPKSIDFPVKFHYLVSPFPFRDRSGLKVFLQRLFNKENVRVQSLDFIFCTDSYLLKINKQYLNHHFLTDIITFNLAEPNAPIQGEIYISIERIKENAVLYETGFYRELHRVVFHGALHLCGYNDHTAAQVAEMRTKEAQYLGLYFQD